jgi:hypothetical protein
MRIADPLGQFAPVFLGSLQYMFVVCSTGYRIDRKASWRQRSTAVHGIRVNEEIEAMFAVGSGPV